MKRVAVIGLDGVPYSLLKSLVIKGAMPHFAELMSNGSFIELKSSIPPISAVAWTSFLTGKNPGEHGIFGFTDVDMYFRRLILPSFDHIKSSTIWHNHPDKKSIVINLPFTYPARPLNGKLIAGFVAPIFGRAVYPESLLPWLQKLQYKIDVDAELARKNVDLLFQDLYKIMEVHETVAFELLKEQWDLYVAVVTGTDRLHHFLFDALINTDHVYHDRCIQYYQRLDVFIGKFVNRLSSDTRLILLSDHGFTELKFQVYINNILRSLGYLNLQSNSSSLDAIFPGSKAFALEPGRVYFNTRSRFQDGVVTEANYGELRAELKMQLEKLSLNDLGIFPGIEHDPSLPLFDKVLCKEDVFYGPCIDYAPDLVILPSIGIDLKAPLRAARIVDKDIFTGTHTLNDAFLLVCNPPMNDDFLPEISDVYSLMHEGLS
jgi:predicted AlkP superfamily phosphohydrolase/phosphomutase